MAEHVFFLLYCYVIAPGGNFEGFLNIIRKFIILMLTKKKEITKNTI